MLMKRVECSGQLKQKTKKWNPGIVVFNQLARCFQGSQTEFFSQNFFGELNETEDADKHVIS